MKKLHGLSLLELMIALVMIGILSAIALPMYSQHFTRAKRFEAEVMLMKLASALEQYYTINNTYENATLANLNFPAEIAGGRYQLAINQIENSSYNLQALPVDQQAKADPNCATLMLNSLGEKTITGLGKIEECW